LKIAILSDIHSNLEALEAAFEDLQHHEIDVIYCTGDLVGYASNPNEVISLLQQNNVRCLLGNHDYACIDPRAVEDMVRNARLTIDYTIKALFPEHFDFLKELPSFINENGVWFTHGLPPDSFDEYVDTQSKQELLTAFASFNEKVAFVGHTHLIEIYELTENGKIEEPIFDGDLFNLIPGSRYIISAGSVGQPRDDNREAGYLIFDSLNQQITKRRITYDVDWTIEKINSVGLPRGNGLRLLKD
jgi:predicted phosphodiesterase